MKREQVEANDLAKAGIWMKRLNKSASQLAEFGLRGGTDITDTACSATGWKWQKPQALR
ncbi:MAG: hypothetical protein U0X92_00410 [Anaerolineales bacterium]